MTRLRRWWSTRAPAVRGWWSAQGMAARVAALAVAGGSIGTIIGGAALLVSAGGSGEPPVLVQRTPTLTATPTTTPTTPTPTPTLTPEPTPTPTPTPEPPVSSVRELTDGYGEPPDSTLGRFRIPSLGIDAPLGMRVVDGNGTMPNPTGPSDVVWYDFDEWEGLGGAPGGGQNAIFAGHVDYASYIRYADVNYRGKAVFQSVALLSPEDVIEVEVNGETLRYAVEWRRQVDAGGANWAELLSADVGQDSITLITCGGDFNTTTRSYSDRVVVRAIRI